LQVANVVLNGQAEVRFVGWTEHLTLLEVKRNLLKVLTSAKA